MWESNSYQAHKDHKMLYEALEKSMARDHTDHLLTDLAKARRKKKKRHASPKTPPGAVTFRDKYEVQMIMRFNEIHKFSDGTLQQIDEALDYRVKEFKVNRMNPSLNIRFWTMKDVDRSKEFMFAI
ncbi:hypothetical protein Tco_1196528 [Tanacetum coccineum]